MSVTIEGNQGLGQLVSLMEFGFLKVHQRLLRQEILLSEINTNANEDAKLASLRHNDLLNILKVVYKDTHDHVSRPYMTASYEVDFDEHIRGNLTGWTFHFSPLCFKIREQLKKYEGADVAHLQSEQEGRRLMQYLAQLKPNKSVSATLRIAGGRSSRSGYFRFLHNVINSMASLSAVPEKRVVRYISVQLCAFWNCGLSYAKSHDNKLIHLISFEDVCEDLWRILTEKKYKAKYRAKLAAMKVTPTSSGSHKKGTWSGKKQTAKGSSSGKAGSAVRKIELRQQQDPDNSDSDYDDGDIDAAAVCESDSDNDNEGESGEDEKGEGGSYFEGDAGRHKKFDSDNDDSDNDDSDSDNDSDLRSCGAGGGGSVISVISGVSGLSGLSNGSVARARTIMGVVDSSSGNGGNSIIYTPSHSSGDYWIDQERSPAASDSVGGAGSYGRSPAALSQHSTGTGRSTRSASARLSATAAAASAQKQQLQSKAASGGIISSSSSSARSSERAEIPDELWGRFFRRSVEKRNASSSSRPSDSHLSEDLAAEQDQQDQQEDQDQEVVVSVNMLYERACLHEQQLLQLQGVDSSPSSSLLARLRFLGDTGMAPLPQVPLATPPLHPASSVPVAPVLQVVPSAINQQAAPDRSTSSLATAAPTVTTAVTTAAAAAPPSSSSPPSPSPSPSATLVRSNSNFTFTSTAHSPDTDTDPHPDSSGRMSISIGNCNGTHESDEESSEEEKEEEVREPAAKKHRVGARDASRSVAKSNCNSRESKHRQQQREATSTTAAGTPVVADDAAMLPVLSLSENSPALRHLGFPAAAATAPMTSSSSSSSVLSARSGKGSRGSFSSSSSVCSVRTSSDSSTVNSTGSSGGSSSCSRETNGGDGGEVQWREHRKRKKHKNRKQEKNTEVSADNESVEVHAQEAVEERRRTHKNKHKRKHRDNQEYAEEDLNLLPLTQCSE